MMKITDIPLHQEWAKPLNSLLERPDIKELELFLDAQYKAGKCVYPEKSTIFAALNSTPLSDVKVVVLGQDPYHGEGQAHGLSFSVPLGQTIPPSLKNIYKELQTDQGCTMPVHGNLAKWSEQGVLLLNSVLTVEHGLAGSHQKQGWEAFTDEVIQLINDQCDGVVFLLWGAYAHKKGRVIDEIKHLVLKAPHPSPLSCYRGFYGCQHFSKANQYLHTKGRSIIDWQIN